VSPTLTVPDGRTLAYETWGDPDGFPVLSLHGTPGSRLGRYPDEDGVIAAGVRLVTYDRPGYGGSTRRPGRRIVDCVADVTALADHLGLSRFAVTGASGGGPHCLAVAAGLPDRVLRARCEVGVAPWDAPGLDWLEGMDPENVTEFSIALQGADALTAHLDAEAGAMRVRMEQDPTTIYGSFDLPDADRRYLADPRVQAITVESHHAEFAQGVGGWVDDDLAFTSPWGVDLSAITVPVDVAYGQDDVMVPASHGRWLASHVPGAQVHVASGEGHMGDIERDIERLRTFVAAAQR
jgi:pimeloyl-ACP methyl ester carboxylesterase